MFWRAFSVLFLFVFASSELFCPKEISLYSCLAPGKFRGGFPYHEISTSASSPDEKVSWEEVGGESEQAVRALLEKTPLQTIQDLTGMFVTAGSHILTLPQLPFVIRIEKTEEETKTVLRSWSNGKLPDYAEALLNGKKEGARIFKEKKLKKVTYPVKVLRNVNLKVLNKEGVETWRGKDVLIQKKAQWTLPQAIKKIYGNGTPEEVEAVKTLLNAYIKTLQETFRLGVGNKAFLSIVNYGVEKVENQYQIRLFDPDELTEELSCFANFDHNHWAFFGKDDGDTGVRDEKLGFTINKNLDSVYKLTNWNKELSTWFLTRMKTEFTFDKICSLWGSMSNMHIKSLIPLREPAIEQPISKIHEHSNIRKEFEKLTNRIYPLHLLTNMKNDGYNPIIVGYDHANLSKLNAVKNVFIAIKNDNPGKIIRVAFEIVPPIQLTWLKEFVADEKEYKEHGTIQGKTPSPELLSSLQNYRSTIAKNSHHAEILGLWLLDSGFDLIAFDSPEVEKWITEDKRRIGSGDEEETFWGSRIVDDLRRPALTAIRRDLYGLEIIEQQRPHVISVGSAHALKYDFLFKRDGSRSFYSFLDPLDWQRLLRLWEQAHELYRQTYSKEIEEFKTKESFLNKLTPSAEQIKTAI